MKRKSVLVALLLMGSVSAMNQENYSESDVRSLLRTISQQINSVRQDYAEQMQTLMDQHQAEVDQLKQSLNDVKEALAQANRRLEMVDERVASELLRLRHDSNVVEYLVPSMNSNEQDGYIASASSVWRGNRSNRPEGFDAPYYAFKGKNRRHDDFWQPRNQTNNDGMCGNTWIQIQLPRAKVCDYIRLTNYTVRTFVIEGSNDGNSWTELLNVNDAGSQLSTKSWYFNNTTAYLYYRMNITRTYKGNQSILIGALDFLRK